MTLKEIAKMDSNTIYIPPKGKKKSKDEDEDNDWEEDDDNDGYFD